MKFKIPPKRIYYKKMQVGSPNQNLNGNYSQLSKTEEKGPWMGMSHALAFSLSLVELQFPYL